MVNFFSLVSIFIFSLNSVLVQANAEQDYKGNFKKFYQSILNKEEECKFIATDKIDRTFECTSVGPNTSDEYRFCKEVTLATLADDSIKLKTNRSCDNIAAIQRDVAQAKFSNKCRMSDPFEAFKNGSCEKFNKAIKSDISLANAIDEVANNNSESKQFSNLGFNCRKEGKITVDYESCVSFATALENWTAGQQVLQAGQQIWAQGEAQGAYANAQGKADDPKAALGAQKTSLEAQKTVSGQQAAVESAKLAHLVTIYQRMPNKDSFSPEAQDPNLGFLLNQKAKEIMKEKLVQIGGSAVVKMLQTNMLASQVGKIEDAMAKVDAFKPSDYVTQQDDAQVVYCQQNPAAPQCLSGQLSYQVDPFSNEGFSFGAGGTGTAYNIADKDATTASNTIGGSGSGTTNSPTTMGSAITPVDKSNAIVDTSTAATVSQGGDPQNAGGGSAGGGGGGGGGGGPAPQKGQEATTSLATGSAVKYSGGAGGVSVIGGSGIKKSGSNNESNPFADMFKNKTAANGALNFRGPASIGNEKGNIFMQISNRYKEVSQNKERLIEYEAAK